MHEVDLEFEKRTARMKRLTKVGTWKRNGEEVLIGFCLSCVLFRV